jgi:hypothetical protein
MTRNVKHRLQKSRTTNKVSPTLIPNNFEQTVQVCGQQNTKSFSYALKH